MSHHIGILDHKSCTRLQIETSTCAVLTAGAIATDEANCYNVIVPLRSLPRFAETISQGYISTAQRLLACDDDIHNCPDLYWR